MNTIVFTLQRKNGERIRSFFRRDMYGKVHSMSFHKGTLCIADKNDKLT